MENKETTVINVNNEDVGNPDNHGQKFLDMIYTSGDEWVNRQIKKYLDQHNDRGENIMLEMQDRELMYITNFYVFSDDYFNDYVWPQIAKQFYLLGKMGLQKVGDEYLIYDIADYKESLSKEIIEAQGSIMVMGDEKQATLKTKDAVLEKASIWGKPWFMFSEHYIKDHIRNLELLGRNLINSQSTMAIQVSKATKSREQELEVKYYPDKPFVMVQGNFEKMHEIGLDNQAEIIWLNLKENITLWEKYRGIRFNISRKDTEVKVDELANDDVQFEFIEIDRMRTINRMLKKMNELYGTDISCKTIIDIKKEEQQETQKQMAKNEPEGEKDNE